MKVPEEFINKYLIHMLDSTVRWSAPVSDGLLPIRTLSTIVTLSLLETFTLKYDDRLWPTPVVCIYTLFTLKNDGWVRRCWKTNVCDVTLCYDMRKQSRIWLSLWKYFDKIHRLSYCKNIFFMQQCCKLVNND